MDRGQLKSTLKTPSETTYGLQAMLQSRPRVEFR